MANRADLSARSLVVANTCSDNSVFIPHLYYIYSNFSGLPLWARLYETPQCYGHSTPLEKAALFHP